MAKFHLSNFITAAVLAAAPTLGFSEAITYTVDDQTYDDVLFGLENAIVDKGLVISEHNHVGEMLERTKADVGGTKTIFVHADIFGFCSAELSRKAMEADPMNIQYCPYQIFAFQEVENGPVTLGFDKMPDGVMKEVESFLDDLTKTALGLE